MNTCPLRPSMASFHHGLECPISTQPDTSFPSSLLLSSSTPFQPLRLFLCSSNTCQTISCLKIICLLQWGHFFSHSALSTVISPEKLSLTVVCLLMYYFIPLCDLYLHPTLGNMLMCQFDFHLIPHMCKTCLFHCSMSMTGT